MNDKNSNGNNFFLTLLFIVFLVMKLTEKCSFWGDSFPRFLKSTEVWWDGWFIVFLPLWIGFPIVVIILIIAYLIGKNDK